MTFCPARSLSTPGGCKRATVLLVAVLGVLICTGSAWGGRSGRAGLTLRQVGEGPSKASAEAGDILLVELLVEGRGEGITGVAVFLTFDDTSLELIPESRVGGKPVPFQQGEWMQGEVYNNETLGDEIANGLANGVAGFQLYYFENSRGSFAGPQRAATGKGVLARFRLRAIRELKDPLAAIRVDGASPTGSQTAYYVQEDPGRAYRFRAVRKLKVDRGLVGDFDGDTRVDFRDFISFSAHFGLSQGAHRFDPMYDLDGDGTVRFGDFLIFADHYDRR